MSDDVVDPLMDTARALGQVAGRLVDALPAIGRVIVDVERDWLDERRREWVERASLVHRTLLRELDEVLANAHAACEALRAVDSTAEPRRTDPAEVGRPHLGSTRGTLHGGPRLGDTAADRVDDERGIRIARLGEDGGEPG